MLEWAASGVKNLTEMKARAAEFNPPFRPTHAQYKRQMENAGVETQKLDKERRRSAAQTGLAVKDARIAKLKRLIERHDKLMDARGKEMESEIAGGGSGLLVRDYKGKDADVPVYKYDAAFIREVRELLKHIAIEVGEWTEKIERNDNVTLKVEYGNDGSEAANN